MKIAKNITNLNTWELSNSIYDELILFKNLVFNPCQFTYSAPLIEKESSEYGACSLEINSQQIKFRVAKITPTKVGQFVSLWKRIGNGPIQPYDINDKLDLFIISVRKDDNFGQFVFPKSILYKYGILSNNGSSGKRAIRIYPTWDKTENKQAQKTQKWQLEYFLDTSKGKQINYSRAKMLYSCK